MATLAGTYVNQAEMKGFRTSTVHNPAEKYVAAAAPLNEHPFGSPARNELGFANPKFAP
jgi:hypothetical protein